jgi:uncharacterized spore protein YtfJ
MLAVPDAPAAVAWYKRALGAVELWSLGSVAGLEIAGAPFFVGEPEHNRWENPATLGTTSARVEVFCDDPDSVGGAIGHGSASLWSEGAMSNQNLVPFASVAEVLQRSLSIRHVYGEPVQYGTTIVIPVAKVAYGFGAGGGRGPARRRAGAIDESLASQDNRADAQGAGGGGGVLMTPVGALEIGPRGTRFVHVHPLAPWFGAAAVGLVAGWLLARRRD